jgi:serine/threonine-protein kinase
MTPGLVDREDPAPTTSGMVTLRLDSFGRLLYFDRVPPQKQTYALTPAPPDWAPLFAAANLDFAQLKPADPQWLSLSAFDARAAWTGTWPGTSRPLRVEAAVWSGYPVYFHIVEPWTKTDRTPQDDGSSSGAALAMLALIAVGICAGSFLIARRNLAQGRGDRRGAWRLAAFMFCVHMALWLARSHMGSGSSALGLFLLALCTSVFYGVVIWTVYLALEPHVRRRWPQALMGWSSLLIGRVRDPIVGRDVLIGAAIGVVLTALSGLLDEWMRRRSGWTPNLVGSDLLTGAAGTIGRVLLQTSHGVREGLFFFFLVFLFRVVLRNQWLAALAFAGLFAGFNVMANHPLPSVILSFVVLFGFAYALVRWGLLALAVGVLCGDLLENAPITANTSAWYFPSGLLMVAAVAVLAAWAFRTSLGGRKIWKQDLLG